MKVAISAGHYPNKSGAKNEKLGLKEHYEAMKILNLIEKSPFNQDMIFVPTGGLTKKVNWINNAGADAAIEIHFNSSPNLNTASGIETLHYSGSGGGIVLASDCQLSMCRYLPFKNRGLQSRKDLYFLKATKCPSVILEVLFLNNDIDATYLKMPLGHKIIASAIMKGLHKYIGEKVK